MKELARSILQDLTIRAISRYGALGDNETVTLKKLPKHGVYVSHVGVEGIRISLHADVPTDGLFMITARGRGRFTVENRLSRVRLSGVPRRSIQKIIDGDIFQKS